MICARPGIIMRGEPNLPFGPKAIPPVRLAIVMIAEPPGQAHRADQAQRQAAQNIPPLS